MIFPYLRVSQHITGHSFYNVNSTFYVWYDSWEEAEAGTKAHGDRVGWPDMPSAEIPSLAKYVHEHTPEKMVRRLIDGGRDVMTNVMQSYGYLDYLLVYGGVLLLAVGLKWRRARERISANPFLYLFFVKLLLDVPPAVLLVRADRLRGPSDPGPVHPDAPGPRKRRADAAQGGQDSVSRWIDGVALRV